MLSARGVGHREIKNGSEVGEGGFASIAADAHIPYTFHAEAPRWDSPINSLFLSPVILRSWKPWLHECNVSFSQNPPYLCTRSVNLESPGLQSTESAPVCRCGCTGDALPILRTGLARPRCDRSASDCVTDRTLAGRSSPPNKYATPSNGSMRATSWAKPRVCSASPNAHSRVPSGATSKAKRLTPPYADVGHKLLSF